MLQRHSKVCFKGSSGVDKGVCHLFKPGVDKHKKVTAAVLVPTFSPPRKIVDIKTYVAGDRLKGNFPLLIADDPLGQCLLGWLWFLLLTGVIKQ